jgi:hypothetical protein
LNGGTCPDFDAVHGNDHCPLRMELRAKILCNSDCANPQIELEGTMLKYSPKTVDFKTPFNAAKYSFKFVRGLEGNTLAASCAMFGGTFDAGPPAKCDVPLDPQKVCDSVQGTMVNGKCQLPVPGCSWAIATNHYGPNARKTDCKSHNWFFGPQPQYPDDPAPNGCLITTPITSCPNGGTATVVCIAGNWVKTQEACAPPPSMDGGGV